MANPSVTYTFTNGTTADGSQVSQNFSDLIAGMTDGTKSFSIDALTVAGTALFNGPVTLGNATGDTVTINGYISGSIIGSTTAGVPWKGRTSGVAHSAGDVGEKVAFTARTATLTNADTFYATAALATLGAGTWLLVSNIQTSAISGINPVCRFLGILSDNNTADGTSLNGNTALVSIPIYAVAASISGAARTCLTTFVTTTGMTVYGKGYCEDESGQTIEFDGFAIRVA